MTGEVPEIGLDIFVEDCLRKPFDAYRALRDAGPVVQLGNPPALAIARFADVQAALRASDVLISDKRVGFSDSFNSSRGANVLQTDCARDLRMRSAVVQPLTPAALKRARGKLKQRVAARAGGKFSCHCRRCPLWPVIFPR